MPSTYSMVRTRALDSSSSMIGHVDARGTGPCRRPAAGPGRPRCGSRARAAPRPRTRRPRPGRRSSGPCVKRASATAASSWMTPRSALVLARIRGRWTLTATSRPSSGHGPVDLGGRGRRERLVLDRGEQRLRPARSSSDSRISRASSHGNGRASLWSLASSSVHSAGSRSRRLASIWPIFTYVGPRSWSRPRMRAGADSLPAPGGSPRRCACDQRADVARPACRRGRRPGSSRRSRRRPAAAAGSPPASCAVAWDGLQELPSRAAADGHGRSAG